MRRLPLYLLISGLVLLLLTGWLHYSSTGAQSDVGEIKTDIQTRLAESVEQAREQLNQAVNTGSMPYGSFPSFVYSSGQPAWWSDNEFIPAYRNIKGDYDMAFIRTLRHDFVALKRTLDTAEVIVIVPIFDGYKIENRYFRSSFNQDIFRGDRFHIVAATDSTDPICVEGQCLFALEFDKNYKAEAEGVERIITMLFLIGFLLTSLSIYLLSYRIGRRDVALGLVLLLGSFLSLRFVTVELSWPASLISNPLFDSREYAASALNASFADLILNLWLLSLIANYVFYLIPRSKWYRRLLSVQGAGRYLTATLLGLIIALLLHWLHLYFQSIYHNSQVSLDINESLEIDLVRMVALTGYVFFFYSLILFMHVLIRTIRKLLGTGTSMIVIFTVAFAIAAGLLFLIGDIYWISTISGFFIMLLLVATRLPRSFSKLSFSTFLYLFVYLICGAIIAAWSVYVFEQEREVDRKKKFANQFLIDNDQLAEFLLSEINQKVANDFFIQSRLASPLLSKEPVVAKIRQVFLHDYFDKYDVNIFLFNASGESLESSTRTGSPLLKLDVEKYKTGYDGVYFINRQEEGAPKRYLDYIEIKRRGITAGYIVLDMRLKRIIPENVYPEMLVDNRFLSPFQDVSYSYAVFDEEGVAYSSGDFGYDDTFIRESGYAQNETFQFEGYSHVAIDDLNGHRLVISSQHSQLSGMVSDFSFFFIFKVLILLFLIVVYAAYVWWQRAELTYAARIQLYLNIAFFLPLLAVSITTLSLISGAFEREVISENYKKAEEVGNNLTDALSDYINGYSNKDELNRLVADIANYSGADINVFDKSGKLISTNQWAIYDNDLLSEYANYEAYTSIVNENEKALTTRESVGKLEYNVAYFGINSFDTGNLIGFVSIPFFNSDYALEESQIVVITSIINVFTFVFIIFLFISYFATRWLIFPLEFITQKLKRTTLTEFNEPLTWNADDEIGLMVGEYNKMLLNLEENKRALARSEKQSAWREIARQVAHEIKNPLTPMKLTLQHLQRKLAGQPNTADQSKSIESLLGQIDTLSDIVSSFSSFAQMPIPESEKYELTEVVRSSAELYVNHEDLDLRLQLPQHVVYTRGDAQLMGRIISNLILNAIQASDTHARLDVSMELVDDKITLKFRDYGRGIDEDIRSKIFIPNFTTKDTGSGIGLAIAKHGVEHAGGEIWFETEASDGTTFYLELPRVYE